MATTVDTLSKPPFPPKPAPKPGRVKVVRALYKYTAQRPDELSFEKDEVLYVYDQGTDPNWWKAKCNNREGLIPANYVGEQTEEVELPLHEAARRGNISFMRECLESGVSSTGLDAAGNTPLYWASRAGHVDCVRDLLSLPNPAVDLQNKMGDTPLHGAASRGHLEVVQMLLDAGTDASLRNDEGLTAEELANDVAVINAIQMSYRQYSSTHRYQDNDYNDESD